MASKRKSTVARVDALEDETPSDELLDVSKSDSKKLLERKDKPTLKESQIEDDLTTESSGSTGSDLRDVLNCIRNPQDVKHVCHITCSRLKKKEHVALCSPRMEELALCKTSLPYRDDIYENEYQYHDIHYQDYDEVIEDAKPVRIPLVHVTDCEHQAASNKLIQHDGPVPSGQWCYCEDEGTTEGDEDYVVEPVCMTFEDPNDCGFMQYSPPRRVDVNVETGAIEWDKVPIVSDLQDILNCMFPPKVKKVGGEAWMQEVSPQRARRTEVVKLIEVLDMKTDVHQIKYGGVDPVRRQLYEQLFDELIRQETIVSPEMGLILLRIRDEMKMTIAAWESLLDHANNYTVEHISKCGALFVPYQEHIDYLIGEVTETEVERSKFWAEQYLVKFEDLKKRDHAAMNRKLELAPYQARNKLLKEQIRLLTNRDDDGNTYKSHVS